MLILVAAVVTTVHGPKPSRVETHMNTVDDKLYIPRVVLGADCLEVSAVQRRTVWQIHWLC